MSGTRIAGLAFVIGFAFASPVRADSLVTNGGFETGNFTGWTESGAHLEWTGVIQTTGLSGFTLPAPHGGAYDAEFGNFGGLAFITQELATTPGATYDLSFWLESFYNGNGPAEIQVSWNGAVIADYTATSLSSASPQLAGDGQNVANFAWRLFDFSGLTATGTVTELTLGLRNDANAFLLDDVSVRAVPEPSSLLALGVGITTLALRRRRKAA